MNATTPPEGECCERWVFGRFELDLRRGSLKAGDEQIALRPKSFALLSYFVQQPGRLIPKAELLQLLWPDVVVTEDSLVQCVGEVRAALGADQHILRTVPRRGYRFDVPVEAAGQRNVRGDERLSRRVATLTAAFVAVAAAALIFCVWQSRPASPDIDKAIVAHRAIAVLPFADLSGSPSPATAEAVAEDVAMAVAHLDDTVVFANASAEVFRAGKADTLEVAHALAATHVVRGSVQRDGASVLIRVQLDDGRTGAVLWSDRFEQTGVDRQDIQQEIAQRIANALDVRLRDMHLPAGGATVRDGAASELVEQGIYLIRHQRSRGDLLRARALLDTARAIDPTSTAALTYWGMTHIAEVMRRWSTNRDDQIELASQAFERAIRMRPTYAQAYFGRSLVASARGENDAAARACEDAMALWPNEPRCLMRMGFLRLMQGRPVEVMAPVRLALRLNPLENGQVAWAHFYLGMAQFHLQHDEEAYEEFVRASTVDPDVGFSYQWMAAIDALHGRDEKARANLAKYRQLNPGHTVSGLRATELNKNEAFWAQRDRFYAGLRMAGLPE